VLGHVLTGERADPVPVPVVGGVVASTAVTCRSFVRTAAAYHRR
jgi:hypothetical protein